MRRQKGFSLALDLGTTTLAGALLDAQGTVIARARRANPQSRLGADVIRRLERALQGEGAQLQKLLQGGIAALVEELLGRSGAGPGQITTAAAAGNPAIIHLLLNLPVEGLLFPPHRPHERAGEEISPQRLALGLSVPIYLFPLVSGYVGGDLVAFLYAQSSISGTSLFIDVGTNAELALHHGGKWLVTSTAAGPAFEAAEISCGMPVAGGAISDVVIEDDRLRVQTIDAAPARGVCGSGLAAAIAAAREGGLIARDGTLVDPLQVASNLARYLVETESGRALRLYRDARHDVLITQDDIRAFQLAKAAIHAGIDCLLARAGLGARQVEEVVLTGAFGFSLSRAALKKVAMLPENMIDRVRFQPGGALAGVVCFLAQDGAAKTVAALTAGLKPFPLSGTQAFEKAFLNALDF